MVQRDGEGHVVAFRAHFVDAGRETADQAVDEGARLPIVDTHVLVFVVQAEALLLHALVRRRDVPIARGQQKSDTRVATDRAAQRRKGRAYVGVLARQRRRGERTTRV